MLPLANAQIPSYDADQKWVLDCWDTFNFIPTFFRAKHEAKECDASSIFPRSCLLFPSSYHCFHDGRLRCYELHATNSMRPASRQPIRRRPASSRTSTSSCGRRACTSSPPRHGRPLRHGSYHGGKSKVCVFFWQIFFLNLRQISTTFRQCFSEN